MSSGQDYRRTIAPNGSQRINANGETFIFVKNADRDITVDIGGRKVVMRTGSYQEFEPLSGENANITLFNDDPDNAAIVSIVTGTGTYDEKIIRGEITTVPGIKTGSGEYIADTRKKLALDLISVAGTGITENFGDEIGRRFENPDDWGFKFSDGEVLESSSNFFKAFDYNPALHDGVLVVGFTVSNRYAFFEVDPDTQTLIRYYGTVASSWEPRGFTRFGNTLYMNRTNGTPGIYRKIGSGSWELFYSVSESNPALTIDTSGNLYIGRSSGAIDKISPQGNQIGSVSLADSTDAGFGWYSSDVIWCFDNDGEVRSIDTDLNNLGTVGIIPPDIDHGVIVGAYIWAMNFGSGDSSITIRASETVENALAGNAFHVCENAWLGKKPGLLKSVRASADIEVNGGDTSNPTVSGEIIKLILEWYIGRPVNLDYMDYIHAVEIIGSSDINGISYPPIRIQSNGQTFLAAKIPDDFRVIFPIQATLTIDQRAEQ